MNPDDLPLRRFALARTRDWDEVVRTLNEGWRVHQIECVGSPRNVDFGLNGTALRWMSVAAMTFGTEVSSEVGGFRQFAVFLPLSGTLELRIVDRDHVVRVREGCIGVLSAGDYVRTWWSSDCAVVIFIFDTPAFDGPLREMYGRTLPVLLEFTPEIDTSTGNGRMFVQEILWPIVRSLEAGDELVHDPADVEWKLVDWMLRTHPHNYNEPL